MTDPNGDLRLTRNDYVGIIELRRDVRYIRERVDELASNRAEILRELARQGNRITALEVRFWIFAFLVPALVALASMLLGKIL